MAAQEKREVRYSNAPIAARVKPGGRAVASRALIKQGAANLKPKLHVKRGDTVVLISGPRRDDRKHPPELRKRFEERNAWRGTIGKVTSVDTDLGKIVIENVNMVTRATPARGPLRKSGLVTREAPIFASRVMLYCTSCKKATRIKHKVLDNGKKSRICQHCGEAFDA